MIGMRALLYREWLLFFRSRLDIFFSILPPLIYLTFFALNFTGLVGTIDGVPYVQFVVPGIAIMTTLISSANTASRAFNEGFSPMLTELFSFPATRPAYVLSKLLAATGLATLQGAVFLMGGALLFGLHLTIDTILLSMAILAITAFGVAGITLIIALTVQDISTFLVINNGTVQILIWTSTVFYPSHIMFYPLRILSQLNPLTFGSNVLRGALLPTTFTVSSVDILSLVVFSIISGLIAAHLLARRVGKHL
jgi:ABC-2 type transport system permease protein